MIIDLSNLPGEAAAYFQAAKGLVPWEQVFTPDSSVRDVDREIVGLDALVHWAHNEVDGGVYQILTYQPENGGVWLLVEFHPKDWHPFIAEYQFSFRAGRIQRAVLQYSPVVAPQLHPIPLPIRKDWEKMGSLPGKISRVVPRIGGVRIEFLRDGREPEIWDYWVSAQGYGRNP